MNDTQHDTPRKEASDAAFRAVAKLYRVLYDEAISIDPDTEPDPDLLRKGLRIIIEVIIGNTDGKEPQHLPVKMPRRQQLAAMTSHIARVSQTPGFVVSDHDHVSAVFTVTRIPTQQRPTASESFCLEDEQLGDVERKLAALGWTPELLDRVHRIQSIHRNQGTDPTAHIERAVNDMIAQTATR